MGVVPCNRPIGIASRRRRGHWANSRPASPPSKSRRPASLRPSLQSARFASHLTTTMVVKTVGMQATADEATVRGVAVRMLGEERDWRERLEAVHEEQDRLLAAETAHRRTLEEEAARRARELSQLRQELEEMRFRNRHVVEEPRIRRTTSKEREEIIDQFQEFALRPLPPLIMSPQSIDCRDHEMLSAQQEALRAQLAQQRAIQGAFMGQMGTALERLVVSNNLVSVLSIALKTTVMMVGVQKKTGNPLLGLGVRGELNGVAAIEGPLVTPPSSYSPSLSDSRSEASE